jgi:hypothetical protein
MLATSSFNRGDNGRFKSRPVRCTLKRGNRKCSPGSIHTGEFRTASLPILVSSIEYKFRYHSATKERLRSSSGVMSRVKSSPPRSESQCWNCHVGSWSLGRLPLRLIFQSVDPLQNGIESSWALTDSEGWLPGLLCEGESRVVGIGIGFTDDTAEFCHCMDDEVIALLVATLLAQAGHPRTRVERAAALQVLGQE